MEKPDFKTFYEGFLKRVYKFVLFRVGGNRSLAEDLTQDIFLKAFEAYDRYDPAKSKSAWIYTIARNHLINYYKKERPGVDLEELENTSLATFDARRAYMVGYDETELMKAIAKLPPEDAELIRLKYLEGWTFSELTQMLDKSSVALRTQASRALKRLKTLLKNPHFL